MHPSVREARESDLDRIRQLIVDLATYERSAHEVKTTTEQLRAALFGPQPAAYALVAEWQQQVVGLALYFRNFSTWEGVHGLYLEDLYVMPEYRGTGLGKALLMSLAELTVDARLCATGVGCARLEPAGDRLLPRPWSSTDGRVDGLPAQRRTARGRRSYTSHQSIMKLLFSEPTQGHRAPDGQYESC